MAWAGVLMHLFVSYCLVSTLYFYCVKLHSEIKANLLSMLQMGVLFKNLNRTGIISHVCYMKHKTYIYFYSHLLFYVWFFFFFKLIWKYIKKIIYLFIYSVSVRYFVAEQKGTGHVEQRINEFSGRKLPINHVKVGQFYTHWKC